MKITLKYSELENFFFFISNMSEWHDSCRQQYNIDWNKEIDLTKKQEESLQDLKNLIIKYNFEGGNKNSKYLGKYFYTPNSEKEKWMEVKNTLSDQEFLKIQSIFKSLKPVFKHIYNKKYLVEWKIKLKEEISSDKFKKLIKDIKFLFPDLKKQTIRIHLLGTPSSGRTPAGGANIGYKDITLEIPTSKISQWNIEYALATAIHEIIHLEIEKNSLGLIIKDKISTNNLSEDKFKESLVHTIAPYGYPIEKHFTEYKPKNDILIPSLKNNNLYKKIALDSYSLTKNYIEKRKKIDATYIDKFTEIFNIYDR